MADACHNLQNATKDICNLDSFKPIITDLRELLAFMSLSTYTLDHYNIIRKKRGVYQGLESIGETRFATVYWSIRSVLAGIDVFVEITRKPELCIDSEILNKLFADDEDTLRFRRNLQDLNAILMPFARAIQCLEAKETTPGDVYTYWLAVVAQLNDLFARDSTQKGSVRYSNIVKESIRKIANTRFSQLIKSKTASNVYLTAFVLDPENRVAPILSNPNPLHIPTTTLSRADNGQVSIRTKDPVRDIGLSLLRLLQNEYGDEYRPGRTIGEAQAAMAKNNPNLAPYTPVEASKTLKSQFRAYVDGKEPFNRRRRKNENLRMYWQRFLDAKEEDARILAIVNQQALAVKVCSVMPVSMVDERAMSIVKWINTSRKGQQGVGTVSNHLIIRNWAQIEYTPDARHLNPTTVKWRDIKVTIRGCSGSRHTIGEVGSGNGSPRDTAADSEAATMDDRENVLEMMDNVQDVLTAGIAQEVNSTDDSVFELDQSFATARYLDILSDTPATEPEKDVEAALNKANGPAIPTTASAAAFSMQEDEWMSWS
ncbi:hypothetical protein AN958_01409 [Leucoagaricus sp. SymC.cos]|nr:hypothetical protein AN958_11463 [Leucoagaricus sp. SymC.cos]KXN88401.1 hypothetical protein AN958_07383 [Leucoagaricus sp. SymC.cos]KXN91274.1 hypothetical protein AN958_01409 [Leucoagaricus sp. SymC.cos]